MYCSNCGVNNDNNKYCYNCGTLLQTEEYIRKIENYKKKSLVFGIISIVICLVSCIFSIILGVIGLIFSKKYKNLTGKYDVGFGLSLAGTIIGTFLTIITFIFLALIVSVSNSIGDFKENRVEYNYNYDYGELGEFY